MKIEQIVEYKMQRHRTFSILRSHNYTKILDMVTVEWHLKKANSAYDES